MPCTHACWCDEVDTQLLGMACPLSMASTITVWTAKQEWNGGEAQPEEIIGKLREVVALARRVNQACRHQRC